MLARYRFHRRLRKLTQLWKQYRDMVTAAYGIETPTFVDDNRLLRLKADIAARLQRLRQEAPTGLAGEVDREITAMTAMLGVSQTRGKDASASTGDLSAFSAQWHQKYIFLSKLAGASREAGTTRTSLAPATAVPTGFEKSWLPRRRMFGRVVRFLVGVAALAVAVFVIGWCFGVQRDADGGLVLKPPTSVAAAIEAVSDGLRSASGIVTHAFAPVIAVYGTAWTMAMLGILLLSVAYWAFLRG